MKEYFDQLSSKIKTLIQTHSPLSDIKAFEHLACDGAVCDPKHHHILFEDDTIRVIDVILDAKEDETFHRHERCAVMYVDRPASIEYYENMADPKEIAWSSNNPEPRTNVIPFEAMHKVKNVDNKQFRAFRIEINADVLKLENHDALLNQIHELVKSEKKSLDLIRQRILNPLVQQAAPVLIQFPKKARAIRKSEMEELCGEAKRFCFKK